MTFRHRFLAALQILLGRSHVTYDWGDIKAEGVLVGDSAALVLLTHDEAERLRVK